MAAFRWWNENAHFNKSSEPPVLILPQQACIIWQDVAPLIHTHVVLTDDPIQYWSNVQKIVIKLTNDLDTPDPYHDFPAFISFLYERRQQIILKTISDCMHYICQFCPDPPGTFFLGHLVFSIADPFLFISVLDHLQTTREPHWTQFMSQRGQAERILDIIIPNISPIVRDDDAKLSELRVIMAKFLTDIIFEYDACLLSLRFQTASNLYTSVLSLISLEISPYTINLFRIAVRLNEQWITCLNEELRSTRIISLFLACESKEFIRPLALQYCINNLGPHGISSDRFASVLIKHSQMTSWDLECLARVATPTSSEAYFIIIRNLSRKLIIQPIWIRSIATILQELLDSDDIPKEVCEWICCFIRRVFVFFIISNRRKKYVRRSFLICTILSSPLFSNIDFIHKQIQSAASAAASYLPALDLFFDTFETPDPLFDEDLRLFDNKSVKLKTFPFKTSSSVLVESKHDNRAKVSGTTNKDTDHQDPLITSLALSPQACSYVSVRQDEDASDAHQTIFLLDDFIDQQKQKLESLKLAHASIAYPNPDNFLHRGKALVNTLVQLTKETEDALLEYQLNNLNEYIALAEEIRQAIRSEPGVICLHKKLELDVKSSPNDQNRSHFKRLRRTKKSLKAFSVKAVSRLGIPNYQLIARKAMANATYAYDHTVGYSPLSKFDDVVYEYLLTSHFEPMLGPLTIIIAGEYVEAAISTLNELAVAVSEKLATKIDSPLDLFFTSMVRISFDQAYLIRPELSLYSKYNLLFLRKSEEFAEKMMSELGLPKSVLPYGRGKVTVSYFLRSRKQHSAESIEFLNNPIDILHALHCVIVNLKSSFGKLEEHLTFENQRTLLLAMLSVYPPSNCVSIAKFLQKWNQMPISPTLQKAQNLFLSAVQQLVPLQMVTEE